MRRRRRISVAIIVVAIVRVIVIFVITVAVVVVGVVIVIVVISIVVVEFHASAAFEPHVSRATGATVAAGVAHIIVIPVDPGRTAASCKEITIIAAIITGDTR